MTPGHRHDAIPIDAQRRQVVMGTAALAVAAALPLAAAAASASPAVPTARTNATARASGFTAKG